MTKISEFTTQITGGLSATDRFEVARPGNTTEFYATPEDIKTYVGGRETLTANRTYYVRTNGNNNNTGLTNTAGGAFLTIQKAVDVAASLDLSIYDVTIQVADGTYGNQVVMKAVIGSGRVIIQGNTTTPSNVLINTGASDCITGSGSIPSTYRFRGLKLQASTANYLINAIFTPNIFIEVELCDFGQCVAAQIVVGQQAFLQTIGNYSISGGSLSHVAVYDGGNVRLGGESSYTVSLSGTPDFSGGFAVAARGGQILAVNQSYSGFATGAPYFVTQQGRIVSVGGAGSGSSSYFPGNILGTADGASFGLYA